MDPLPGISAQEGQHGAPKVLPLTRGARRLLVGVSEPLAEKSAFWKAKGHWVDSQSLPMSPNKL